jgi:DNA-binding MarR family transcriptional regulator
MPDVDPLIHPPARLKLMMTLTAVAQAEFSTIRDTLGVSDSVLSKHVSALVEARYVSSRKGVRAGRRTTWISLTATGRRALGEHVAALRELIAGVPADPESIGRWIARPAGPTEGAAGC